MPLACGTKIERKSAFLKENAFFIAVFANVPLVPLVPPIIYTSIRKKIHISYMLFLA